MAVETTPTDPAALWLWVLTGQLFVNANGERVAGLLVIIGDCIETAYRMCTDWNLTHSPAIDVSHTERFIDMLAEPRLVYSRECSLHAQPEAWT